MRLTFSIVLFLCAHLLVGQITSFPHTQSFEQVFTTGTDVSFIANWEGNEVATTNRIFQGTDARTGSQSLNIIPTSTFSGEILISLNMSSLLGGQVAFYAYSKENSSGSTRPALLYFSTSIDGGANYIDNTQIGDETTFPNNNLTSYNQYTYEMPADVAGESNVVVKIEVKRGPGGGSAAELVMDDFLIKEALPALAITDMRIISNDEIQVQFNQNVDLATAENTGNYSLNYGFGNPISASRNAGNNAIVNLRFGKAFVNNTYDITIDNVENSDASSIASGLNASAKFETPTLTRALVINEIFADTDGASAPSPNVLPNGTSAEFIELYNTTNEAIQITDFLLSGGTIGDFTINAHDYVILTSTTNVAAYQNFGETIGVSSWNTLTNGGEQILLYDQLGNLVDSLTYNLNWYQDSDKADGGWTLEQLNPELICSGESNWKASSSANGGTPGTINSLFDNTPDTAGPTLDSVLVNSPTEITLRFSELIDKSSVSTGSFSLSNGVNVSAVNVRASLRSVDLTLNPAMTSVTNYTLSVSNVKDCAGNSNIENDINFLFDNEPPALERFVFKTASQIHLIFDEPVLESAANAETNFNIDNGIGQPERSNLTDATGERISLTLANNLSLGNSYQLTLNNLQDSLGNTSINQTSSFSFLNDLDTVIVLSDQLLDIYFKKDVNASATQTGNYTAEGLGSPISATLDGSNAKLIHLTFASNFPENSAREISFEHIQDISNAYLQLLNTDFIYDTDDPDLLSIEVIDANTLLVHFDEILDESSAEIVNNYSVNNGIGIPSVANLTSGGTAVQLTFDTSFEQEVENELSYTAIEDLSGNSISTNRTTRFTYDTRPPRFDSLIVYSPKELLLSFSEIVIKSVAENIGNYSVDNGIGNPNNAIQLDSAKNKILLTFNNLGNNESNTLTISNQRDLFTNDLTTGINIEFSTLIPAFGNFQILSDTSIQVQFTKNLTEESAEDVENYGFDNGIGPFQVVQDPAQASRVNIYLTTQLRKDINYRLVVDSLEDTYGNLIAPTNYDFNFRSYLNTIDIISASSLRLHFDKQLDQVSAENISNFNLDGGIGSPVSATLNPANPNQVTLILASNLQESQAYELTISDIKDAFGGIIPHSRNSFLYDVTPPQITAVNSIYKNELEVVFNEIVDPTTAKALNHYSLDDGIGQPIEVEFSSSEQKGVILIFANDLDDGQNYTLSVQRVEDTQGKSMDPSDFNFTFNALAEPAFREVVINEVYFDVDAASALPPYEYVELHNTGAEAFQLRDFIFTDGNDTAVFENQIIESSSFLVLSNGSGAQAFNGLSLTNFPSLSNNGETIYLLDRYENIIDSLVFNNSLYGDNDKADGGYSIELINPEKACFDENNYAASTNANGGTPGQINSIYNNSPDDTAPVVSDLSILSTTSLQLTFNEAMDLGSLVSSNFSLQSGISLSSVRPENAFGTTITLQLNAPFVRGVDQTLIISNIQDCTGNILNTQIDFELGAVPTLNDLLITEIMATPSPVVGLPNLEYVEIYNNTAVSISLSEVYLGDNAGRTPIGGINIDPNSYLILTKSSSVPTLSAYGATQGLNSFPTFTLQDEARLETKDSTIIFSVAYDKSFFKDELKEAGGYSMEMIRLEPSCQSPDNWKGSTDPRGGTPGVQNAVFTSAPDTEAPSVTAFKVLTDTTFKVSFSEAMNIGTLISTNFTFSSGITTESILLKDEFGYQITLEISSSFDYGIAHSLTMNNLRDCAGNLLSTNSFEFAKGRMPQAGELIITEIMADPNPSNGLPLAEYVEIYNSSSEILSLANVVLADLVSSTILPDTLLYPNEYVVLSPNSLADEFPTNTIGLFNWPNLNNDKETLRLFNPDNIELFKLSYTDSWYRNSSKADGGYSLEMIDRNFYCVEENNWIASTDSKGGTPGLVNSVNGNNPDNAGPQLLQAIMLDAGSIQLQFSERLGIGTVDESNFSIDNGITFIAYQLDDTEKLVTLFTSDDLTTNQVYSISATNITDCSGNLINPSADETILIVPAEAESGDIIVNEVLFNPRSGSSRFIEFYNNSSKYINLKDWRVAGLNNNRFISEEDLFIAPNTYFGVTNDIVDIQNQYPFTEASAFIELSSMPSMRDSDGAAIILDSNGTEIDRFDYLASYHSPLLNDVEGVSLERISFNGNSNDENNWFSASSSGNYATPGYDNSQARAGEVSNQIISIEPQTFSPEISGTADFTTLSFNFEEPGNVLNVTIYDAAGNLIKRISQNKLVGTNTFFTWDGTKEDGRRARIGYYMILTEVISTDGSVSYLKDKVAIGGRF